MAQSGRRLTARPVESEQPGAEINFFHEPRLRLTLTFFMPGISYTISAVLNYNKYIYHKQE
ncbi:hypothetical protein [Fictibacillus halophilus]|uniref:hypothetical protein n=1 Tax=Fictibacillus halophilus TaxID=1610490 RepID=UPI001CFAFE6A|nr:hypothetical protein [Fictibacillus halophilus]